MRNIDESRKREPDVVPFERRETLVSRSQVQDLRDRWTAVQTSFVDEPRKAIEEADKLVASAIDQIEETFRAQRIELEKQWKQSEEATTEDLRLALQRYRDFFSRLLSIG